MIRPMAMGDQVACGAHLHCHREGRGVHHAEQVVRVPLHQRLNLLSRHVREGAADARQKGGQKPRVHLLGLRRRVWGSTARHGTAGRSAARSVSTASSRRRWRVGWLGEDSVAYCCPSHVANAHPRAHIATCCRAVHLSLSHSTQILHRATSPPPPKKQLPCPAPRHPAVRQRGRRRQPPTTGFLGCLPARGFLPSFASCSRFLKNCFFSFCHRSSCIARAAATVAVAVRTRGRRGGKGRGGEGNSGEVGYEGREGEQAGCERLCMGAGAPVAHSRRVAPRDWKTKVWHRERSKRGEIVVRWLVHRSPVRVCAGIDHGVLGESGAWIVSASAAEPPL